MMKSKSAKVTLTVCILFGFVAFLIYAQSETSDTAFGKKNSKIRDVNPKEAFNLIKENGQYQDLVILDVRTRQEFRSGHIRGAVNLDYYSPSFRPQLSRFDKGKTFLVYCQVGGRSGNTLGFMKAAGFEEVYNIQGGISAWNADRLPIVR
jgi:phage shock protein E